MGAMDRRRPANAMSKLAQGFVIVVLLASVPLAAQNFEQGPARSPHGPLNVACTSCHTSTSWTPLRRVLEFSHGTHGLRLARAPRECGLPAVSHQTRVLQCRDEVRGLPRRHPSPPVRRPVRTMPYGEGLAGRVGAGGPDASEPVSVAGRARGGGVRILSPGRGQRPVHGSEHGLRHPAT